MSRPLLLKRATVGVSVFACHYIHDSIRFLCSESCLFHRDLFHPGVLFPPVQPDGLGRQEPDCCLYVGAYVCVIIRLRRRRSKHVLWMLYQGLNRTEHLLFVFDRPLLGFRGILVKVWSFWTYSTSRAGKNTVGKFLWKILHYLQEQFRQKWKLCRSELMWLNLLCGTSCCFHTVTTGCQAPLKVVFWSHTTAVCAEQTVIHQTSCPLLQLFSFIHAISVFLFHDDSFHTFMVVWITDW